MTKQLPAKPLSDGQRGYEEKRAAKAGVSLDKWLSMKERDKRDAARAREEATKPPPPAKKPGLVSRLLDLAHKPL